LFEIREFMIYELSFLNVLSFRSVLSFLTDCCSISVRMFLISWF